LRKTILVCLTALAIASPALASDQDDVVMRIQQTIDAWQRQDPAGVAAILAPEFAIIDSLPPYLFKGPNGLADYAKADEEDNKKQLITETTLVLDKAREVKVDGGNAYVVVPAAYRFKRNGEPQADKGTITATMQKMEQQWRIVSWTWTKD
jgi:hypothetical protein